MSRSSLVCFINPNLGVCPRADVDTVLHNWSGSFAQFVKICAVRKAMRIACRNLRLEIRIDSSDFSACNVLYAMATKLARVSATSEDHGGEKLNNAVAHP